MHMVILLTTGAMAREESDFLFINSYQLPVDPPRRVGPQGPLPHARSYRLSVLLFYYIDFTFPIISKRRESWRLVPSLGILCLIIKALDISDILQHHKHDFINYSQNLDLQIPFPYSTDRATVSERYPEPHSGQELHRDLPFKDRPQISSKARESQSRMVYFLITLFFNGMMIAEVLDEVRK